MECRATILGCSGTDFTTEEEDFFGSYKPWGLIVFRRNIVDRAQLSALTHKFRQIVGRSDAPVLVDQEGGRVQRLNAPNWRKYPAASQFIKAAHGDRTRAARLAFLSARLMAQDLTEVGISIDCMPVLDMPVAGADEAIGDRAYGFGPEAIAVIARAAAEGLLAGGVLPVLKHMPGHGRALVDSHLALPVVDARLEDLRETDFKPFNSLKDFPIAMTGHIVFSAIDPSNPATTSARVISSVIREEIGFDGLLISDDLSMKALSGGFTERSKALFAAGCDIALHCNGVFDEARAVIDASPTLSGKSLMRAEAALSRIEKPVMTFDGMKAAEELDAALALID